LDVPAAAKDATRRMLYCPTFHLDKNIRAVKFPKWLWLPALLPVAAIICHSRQTALNHARANERNTENNNRSAPGSAEFIQQALGKRRSKEPLRQQGKCSLKTK
jgi:hypothetical protein